MELIVEMRFGSHLYGTATPLSDIDLKGVYLPEARDILLQQVPPVIVMSPPKAPGEKNRAGDIDRGYFSLQRWLALLAEGQTMALDMLFAPDSAMTMPPAPLWREIQAAAPRLVSRRASVFLGYCRRQANTFGVKASRIAAARKVLALLATAEVHLGTIARLGQIAPELAELAGEEHIGFVDLPAPGGGMIRHLEVCDRKTAFTASIKTAREMVQRLVNEYGQRTLAAERREGIDWKALSHAVRVGYEAVELFRTGAIAFPLRDARHLRRIKCGEIPYKTVAAEIEHLLGEVEAAAEASSLPDAPGQDFIDDLVARAYRGRILADAPEQV